MNPAIPFSKTQGNPGRFQQLQGMMERKEDQFISEVEKLKKIVQNNETIQEEVTKNISSVEDELSQVEVLMKGMKSDILQFRYALDGMTEYSNQLEIVDWIKP